MKNNQPAIPRWMEKFLLWFCREEIVEEITGDLNEIFLEEMTIKSLFYARLMYSIRVLGFFKPSNISIKHSKINTMLLRNYLLIASRNLLKNKSVTTINLSGLLICLISSVLIIKYVSDELSYDTQYDNYQNIYRVAHHVDMTESEMNAAVGPGLLGYKLKEVIPEIAGAATFSYYSNMTINIKNEKFFNTKAHYSSSTFFDVFDYPFYKGNSEDVFKKPNSAVLTEAAALRYYGTKDVIGKAIKYENGLLTITGVLKDLPSNMHFRPEIITYLNNDHFTRFNWKDYSYYSYIKLQEGTDLQEVENKLIPFFDKYLKQPVKESFGGTGYMFLQPVSDIHLFSDLSFEVSTNNQFINILIMISLAVFIVLVACINYTNMTTAQSTRRLLEIGVRKVMGSNKKMVLIQFFIESLLISGIAAVLAILIIPFILPYFNYLADKAYTFSDVMAWQVIIIYLGITLFTGIIGAIYPALFLSKFKTGEILRRSYSFGKFRLPVNKILNAFQFSVALVMIVLTITGYLQINFMKNQTLGFNKENIFKVDLKHMPGEDHLKTIKTRLLENTSIQSISTVNQVPGDIMRDDGLAFEAADGTIRNVKTDFNMVDEAYLKTLKIDLLSGRDFEFKSDKMAQSVIVNEKLTKSLGYLKPEDALGKKVTLPFGPDHKAKIIGVMDNVHLQSLHHEVLPYMITHLSIMNTQLLVKVNSDDLWETHDFINEEVAKMTSSSSHTISLLDQDFWEQYKADERRSKILTLFSGLVILLSFFGLVGLISFQVRNQAKEINVRKVFGAAFKNILKIYLKQYAFQIIFSLIVALPLSLFLINKWLVNFAFHIETPYFLLVLVPLSLIVIILIVIGIKVNTSFNGNPANYLREA